METMTDKVIERLKAQAGMDSQFRKLHYKLLWLELEFEDIIGDLPDEKIDLIWDFVFTSNAWERRLLELACDYLEMDELGNLKARTQTRPMTAIENTE